MPVTRWPNRRLVLSALVPVALVAGCTSARQAVRPYAPPAAADLLAAVRAHQAVVQGASLETRTTSWLGGDRVRGTVLMLVDRAGRLRFEAEVALRGTVATLTTDGQQFALLEGESGTFKYGPACPQNVASLVRIPLAPKEIAAILLGDAPVGPEARIVDDVEWEAEAAADVLTLDQSAEGQAAARLRVKLQRQSAGFRVVGVEGASPGAARPWRVGYEDFETTAGQSFPRLIRFAEPGRSFDQGVEIKVRERTVNPATRADVFTLQAPSGMPTTWVPCPPG